MTARSVQLQSTSHVLLTKEKDILTQETEVADKIRETSEEALRVIREQEKKLVLELKDRSTSSSSVLKNMSTQVERNRRSIDQITEYANGVLSDSMSPDMISSYQDLISEMDSVLEESLLLGNGDISMTSLQFLPSKRRVKLGRLRHKEDTENLLAELRENGSSLESSMNSTKSFGINSLRQRKENRFAPGETLTLSSQPHIQLISCFGKQGARPGEFNSPGDVCFLPTSGNSTAESFVVADTNNNRLQVFSTQGTFIKVIGEGQIKPWGVAITKKLHIVVSDALDKCIKIFNMEGLCLQKFGKFLCPSGIAVNSAGNFVVTDFFSASVYVIDNTGKALSKFDFRTDSDAHMSGRSHVSVSKRDRLVISDTSNNRIKIFNKSGHLIHHVLSTDINMSSNSGVCTDHLGNVFIADTLGSQISILNKEGKLLSHLDFKSGMRNFASGGKPDESGFNGDPTGLAISRNGHLILTYSKSNQVQVYKLVYKQCALQLKVPRSQEESNTANHCPVHSVKF